MGHQVKVRRGRFMSSRLWKKRSLPTLVMLLVLATSGCFKPQVRSQSEDEVEKGRYPVKVVGDVTAVGNADPIAVGGYGLVIGLNGTGCDPRKGEPRRMLEHELRKGKNRDLNMKKLLASPDNALVQISGVIPAGGRKGDLIDLEVRLPDGSRATSLKGGYLYRCTLRTYERAGNISERYQNSDTSIMGHPVVNAEGPVQVGFGATDKGKDLKKGRLWKGGLVKVSRPFHLIMTPGNDFARLSSLAADRINGTFYSNPNSGEDEIAHAKDNTVVMLGVPPRYRRNLRRYLRVIRFVPLSEEYTDGEAPAQDYRSMLQKDILDPAHCVMAAMRLEALGNGSAPTLKMGLKSKDPLIRFVCAEALTYLGHTAGVEELGKVARDQPYFRAFALTALASLDESVCSAKLRELLWSDLDDETRYGAFRALKALDPRDSAVTGKVLARSFTMHEVAPSSKKPLVHMSLSKRSELVIFGRCPELRPPFALSAGEHTITAGQDDQRCTVSFFPRDGKGTSRRRCSLKLTDIVQTMAEQGATYAEVTELIHQVDKTKTLGARVRYDALPQAVSVRELAVAGAQRKRLMENPDDKEAREMIAAFDIIKSDQEHDVTPTLFERPSAGVAWAKRRQAAESLQKKNPKGEKRSAYLDQ